jgi:sugar (pentulose or hexulose) kinase
LSSVLELPLTRYASGDFWPALGAARLAIRGSPGLDMGEIAAKPVTDQIVVPDESLADSYAHKFRIYKRACQASFDFTNALETEVA